MTARLAVPDEERCCGTVDRGLLWEAVGDPRFGFDPVCLLGRHERDDRAQMRVKPSPEISESYVDSMSHRIAVYNNDIKGGMFQKSPALGSIPYPLCPLKRTNAAAAEQPAHSSSGSMIVKRMSMAY